MKRQLLMQVACLLLSLPIFLSAQTSTLYFTNSGGSFAGEKWISITTGPDNTGTVLWSQGNGTIGDGSGLLTDQAFTVTDGVDFYINCYDQYDDSWDGTTYEVRDATGGGGLLVANNGGASPDDGADTDGTSSWDGTEDERESSELANYSPPSCTIGAGTAVAAAGCDPVNGVMIDVTITDLGDGSIVVTNDGGAADVTVTSLTTVSIGPFAFSSNVVVTLEHPTDPICNVALPSVTIPAACPPANDECGSAIALTVGSGICTTEETGTNVAATDSGIAHSCASYSGGDTWFSVTVPASGNLIIQSSNVAGSFTDAGMAAYTDCTGATEIDCDDDGNPDPSPDAAHSRIEIADVALANTTVYVAVWEYGNNSFGEFNVCAWEPCEITTIAATPSACNPADNTYTVDVVVTSGGTPTTGTLDINGQSFAVGASPQTVTLVGLTANGATDVDVTASFSDGAGCSLTETAAYDAPADCAINCAINSITVGTTSTCTWDGSTSTFSQTVTIDYSGAPAGGTLDVTVGGTTVNEAISSSPQVVVVTGIPADGMTLDVTAAFSMDAACTLSSVGSVTAPDDCGPPANDECANAIALTVGNGICTATETGTNVDATDSGIAHSCASYNGGDTWFSVMVPASGNLIIQSSNVSGSFTDAGMAAYTDCTGSTEIDCDDDGNPDAFPSSAHSRIEISDPALAGTTIYVAVWEYGNNLFGEFDVCAWEPCGITGMAITGGAPCAANLYDVEYTITYNDPLSEATELTVSVDGISETVTLTGSPQVITLTGLTSDGLPESAAASLDGGCLGSTLMHNAPAACNCIITSAVPGESMNCSGATYDLDVVITYDNSPGGNVSVTGLSTGDQLGLTPGASPWTLSLTGLPVDGNTENFVVTFDDDTNCNVMGTFDNPVACPPDCASADVITCAEIVDITLDGNGAWNGNPCYFSSPGAEKVYSFTPDVTGVHNLVKTAGSGYIDYQWKAASGATCDNTGWTCIDDITSNGNYAIGSLTAGVEYWILLDSEGTSSRSHTFHIECPVPPISMAALSAGTSGCITDAPAVMVDGTKTKVNIVDAGGNIIAAIGSSESLGMVSASYIRYDANDSNTRDYFKAGAAGDGYDLIDRSIVITPDNNPVGDVSVFLYFTDDEYTEITTDNDSDNASGNWAALSITKFDTDDCADMANPQNMSGEGVTRVTETQLPSGDWEVEIEVSSFSGFQVHEGINALLPVKLNSFTAKAEGRHNMIEWSTASEINVVDHTLMKSNDAINWDILGIEDGKLNSIANVDYAMMDLHPSAVTYYKLMTTDVDGSTSYSPVVSVTRNSERSSEFLGASPVPTRDVINLNIYSKVDDYITITLTDISGKRILVDNRALSNGDHQLPLDLSDLTNGIYMVTITSDHIQQTHRVIKN